MGFVPCPTYFFSTPKKVSKKATTNANTKPFTCHTTGRLYAVKASVHSFYGHPRAGILYSSVPGSIAFAIKYRALILF